MIKIHEQNSEKEYKYIQYEEEDDNIIESEKITPNTLEMNKKITNDSVLLKIDINKLSKYSSLKFKRSSNDQNIKR